VYEDCPEKKGTVEASVILDTIQSGESVTRECVIVTGDLVLLPNHLITSSIAITNSIFQGKVSFEDVEFSNIVDFRGTTFAGETSFMGSLFRQGEFEGAYFQEATHFSDLKLSNPRVDKHARFFGHANFKRTVFEKYVDFSRVEFDNGAEFGTQNREESFNNRSIFKGDTIFIGAKFKGLAHFEACEFLDVESGVEFRGARFEKDAYFQNAIFKGYTDFNGATFSSLTKGVGFAEANFHGYFTDFRNVLFNGIYGNFRATKFTGEFVSFRNARFRNISDQEIACRKARKQLENSGNRNEADHNFYSEMEARRRQEGITKAPSLNSPGKLAALSFYEFIDYFNYAIKNHEWSKVTKGFIFYNLFENILLQKIFGGYGIFWYWIAIWWLLISIILGFFYWWYQGIEGATCLWQCIYFSFLVAFTRGYGDYHPISNFELLVTGEIVFGLIMFGVFIASISRKYMRG
jgi:uncharacterized protein YjbI with pentapeptide repeats